MAKCCEPDCTCGKHTKIGKKCLPGCTCGRHTAGKPRCAPGCTCTKHRPRTQAEREAISRAQRERHRRALQQSVAEPVLKKCSRCGEWKDRQNGFPWQARTLADGEIRRYPKGECRECARERRRQWKARLSPDERRERNHRYYENQKAKDPERLRRYKREYSALQRRINGVPARGAWKKYRDRPYADLLPRKPFADWLELVVKPTIGLTALARQLDVDESRLRTIVRGSFVKEGREYAVQSVTLDLVDRALVASGTDTMLWELYPENMLVAA